MLAIKESFRHVRLILENRKEALDQYVIRKRTSPLQLIYQLHFKALISFPVGILLGPFTWLSGWKSMKTLLVLSLLLIVLTFVLAYVFDKMTENSGYRELESLSEPIGKNITLYMQLPVASTGLFYLLHPVLGLLVLFMTCIYCIWNGLESVALFNRFSRLKSLGLFIRSLILLIMPLLLLSFLVAGWKTIYYIYIL